MQYNESTLNQLSRRELQNVICKEHLIYIASMYNNLESHSTPVHFTVWANKW